MTEECSHHHDELLRLLAASEPAIRAFVRRLVPTQADAADVMQEVVLVLWRKFDQLAEKEDFQKFAFGVVRLETLAWLRDKARDRHVLGEGVLGILAHEAAQAEADAPRYRVSTSQIMIRRLLYQGKQRLYVWN